MASLDIVGYLVINAGGTSPSTSLPMVSASDAGKGVYLPLREGSSFDEGPALTPLPTAVGLIEAINFSVGVVSPVLRVRTYAFTDWFTAPNLRTMLGIGNSTPGSGDGFRAQATGLLTSAIGTVQFKFAGEAAIQYPFAKVDQMSIAWGAAGTPLDIGLTLRLYGVPKHEEVGGPHAVTSIAGGVDLSKYGASASPGGSGLPWHSQGVTYLDSGNAAFLTEVFDGALQFDNGLTPDLTTPTQQVGLNGRCYPNEFFNGLLNYTVQATQTTDATAADVDWGGGPFTPPLPWVTSGWKVRFKSPDGGSTITFVLSTLAPDRQRQVRMGTARIRRTYRNMRSTNNVESAYVV